MEKIKLFNRDGADIWLEKVTENTYKLATDESSQFYTKYFRIIGNDINHPEAIDPPGGPFISIGSIYGNKKIVKITYPPALFYTEDVTV